MARISSKEKEFFTALDRLSDAEGRLRTIAARMGDPIAFYRFERIAISPVEDARLYAVLSRTGQRMERSPILCRSKLEGEWMLRMSGAVSLLRCGMMHRMYNEASPAKLWWDGDCFWRDADVLGGNIRRTSEIAVAAIGQDDPLAMAEIMTVLWRAFGELGVRDEDLHVRLNAIGCGICRAAFRSAMSAYLRGRSGRLCKACRVVARRTPIRLTACADERCVAVAENAPQILDFLCDGCTKHLRALFECFDEARLPYFLDSSFYREASFFNDFIFEFRYKTAGSGADAPGAVSDGVVLAEGGRMILPVREGEGQRLMVVERKGERFTVARKEQCLFVPLIGRHGWEERGHARGPATRGKQPS